MLKSQQWFTDHIGSDVFRGDTKVFIKDYEMAKKLFTLQDENYTFSDHDSNAPAIHFSDSKCLSCEA